jgi:hypothetical protein
LKSYIIIMYKSRAGDGLDALAARLTPKQIGAFLIMPKRQRPSPSNRDRAQRSSAANRTLSTPRPLSDRDRNLIALYSYCQLGMTPQQFYAKWNVTQEELALICSRSISTVGRWFSKGRYCQRPTSNDLRHLALMDFLLEHVEEIPKALFDLLCSRKSRNRE